MLTDPSNKYKGIAMHEMGHVLGWLAHSTTSTDVMYDIPNSVTSLTTRDKDHITQIYKLFY